MITAPDNGPPLCACGCGEHVLWTRPRHYRPRYLPGHHLQSLHQAMRGAGNGSWKGGLRKVGDYIYVYNPNHPQVNSRGYVKRSYLVAAEMLGRLVMKGEEVHHINHDTFDDSPANLAVLKKGDHARIHVAEAMPKIIASARRRRAVSTDTALAIRAAYASSANINAVAREFGVKRGVVTRIVKRTHYRDIA